MIFRKRFRYLLLFLFVLFVLLLLKRNFEYYSDRVHLCKNLTQSQITLQIKRHLLKSIRYSRNQVVKNELFQALSLISNNIHIEMSNVKYNIINSIDESNGLHDVCLEEFNGAIDHPLYNLGQIEIKCNKKPFEQVLTFVILVDKCSEITVILNGTRGIYKKSKIIFGSSSNENCDNKDKNVKFMNNVKNGGDILNILNEVNTEYLLFATNIYHFDNQSKIERLVQMISYTDIKIAAGGVRLENGKFTTGCYQMGMKMYTLKFVEGYDMSFNSCLLCDYSSAPFVTRKSFLQNQLQNKRQSLKSILVLELYTDLLSSKSNQNFVCPDVMFHTHEYDLSIVSRDIWRPFVTHFELNRIILPNGQDVNFTCSEAKMSCYKQKGIMVPLCCLNELSDSLKFMNQILRNQNITFEVLEGTVMGGLKYNNILFWERDADTNFRVQKIDKLEEKLNEIKGRGYSMTISYECPHKRDHEKCRRSGWHGSIYYAYQTSNWRTEMYGVTYILSDFRGSLKNPTKINIDGEWYITYTNPALYGRNIYGGDIFQHIEHNSALGISQKEFAKLFHGYFAKCPRPGFHGCLDNFAGEGNLQFLDIYI